MCCVVCLIIFDGWNFGTGNVFGRNANGNQKKNYEAPGAIASRERETFGDIFCCALKLSSNPVGTRLI